MSQEAPRAARGEEGAVVMYDAVQSDPAMFWRLRGARERWGRQQVLGLCPGRADHELRVGVPASLG